MAQIAQAPQLLAQAPWLKKKPGTVIDLYSRSLNNYQHSGSVF